VGRAADAKARAPRLIELTWGKPKDPKLTLVGKGVCFDSGGLDIKSADGMR
jgi:leucyl aminopeptidase